VAVPSAFYDSGFEPDMPRNDETQVDTAVLEKISEWLSLPVELTAVIMWLYGAAGAGKSVIAQAMAEILESQQQLLATFFFSCDDPSRNHIKSVIATLAYNITLSVPESRPLITATIEMDPHYESHLWDSFLYGAPDLDFAGLIVTLRCPDIQ